MLSSICLLLNVCNGKLDSEIQPNKKKKIKFRLNIEIIQYHLSYLF